NPELSNLSSKIVEGSSDFWEATCRLSTWVAENIDRRVPVPNAFELYQGLQDVGVETKLIIYKGFGHGITKPKERLAAMWHNWQWFCKYIWNEEIEIPVE
ncbi:unnamed protein product, partial [marine sediment metagenome]